MRIVELHDYSMVVMKDSEDPPWVNVGDFYREAVREGKSIMVDIDQITYHYVVASDAIYSAGRLILYFDCPIPDRFHLHDKVALSCFYPYNN